MPKVTIHENTPSQMAVAKAAEQFTVRDSVGRTLVLRKPGLLAQYRLVEVIGDAAKNEVYMNMVLPLIYVASIDGEAISQPANKIQLDALINRIESHGLEAIGKCLKENFAAPDPEATKEAIKK